MSASSQPDQNPRLDSTRPCLRAADGEGWWVGRHGMLFLGLVICREMPMFRSISANNARQALQCELYSAVRRDWSRPTPGRRDTYTVVLRSENAGV